jgi:hypothetical protein
VLSKQTPAEEKDNALGELLVVYGGYFGLADLRIIRRLDHADKACYFPVDRWSSFTAESGSQQLRHVSPAVATMKDAGLCNASYAALLNSVDALIKAQHLDKKFNLHQRVANEKSSVQERDLALRTLFLLHGSYLSLPEFEGKLAIEVVTSPSPSLAFLFERECLGN